MEKKKKKKGRTLWSLGKQEQHRLRNGGKGQKYGQCWGHSAALDRGTEDEHFCPPPPGQLMDSPLQLEADEKVEENWEKSREQCRGVSGER